jgi:hypothetical protein
MAYLKDCNKNTAQQTGGFPSTFLHNGQSKPSIPIAHQVYLKDTYDNMKILLEAMQSNVQQWKVTGMVMRTQGGRTKFCHFAFLWDNHSIDKHYGKRD